MEKKAVLTGDIVGSTRLSIDKRKELFRVFPVLSERLTEEYSNVVPYQISNFRGDGWQLIVDQPQKALEISIFIRSFFRFRFSKEALDSRIAIGIGQIDFIPKNNISGGDGPAYIISGRQLENLKSERMSIDFAPDIELSAKLGLQGIVTLLDHIATKWSESQSQVIYWALQEKKQIDIAQKWYPLPISQGAVSKNLASSGWDAIKKNLEIFEKIISDN